MRRIIFFIIILKSLLLVYHPSSAQISGASIYLPGNYVEVGIAENGSWGAGPSPTGYYPYTGWRNISSVYNWQHNGWTTPTAPGPIFGDYTFPGTPFEGWSMQVNGARSDAFYTTNTGYGASFYNQTAAVSKLTGSNTSYTNTGGNITAVWQGSTTGTSGGLSIRQTTRIDNNASWVVVTTVFTNTSAAAIPGVYYWRTCDGDDDETYSGSFATNNTIVYQNDADHRVMASTTGTVYSNAYMSLGTKDCRAKCMIYADWAPYPAYGAGNSLDKIYAGTATGLGSTYYTVTYPTITTFVQDIAIGLIYNLGTIGAGDSTVVSYAYIYDGNIAPTTDIDSAFPEPQLAVNGTSISPVGVAPAPIVDTFNACLYPGMTTLPVNINFASDKDWTWSTWSWSPGTGLATTNGVTNSINLSFLPSVITYTITGTGAAFCNNRVMYLTVETCNGAVVNAPCLGDSLIFNSLVGSPSSTYSWYGPSPSTTVVSTNPTFFIYPCTWADTGIYHLVVRLPLSVPDTYAVAATIIPPPSAITGPSVVCPGATIMLSDSPTGGTWSCASPGVATITSGTGIVSGVSAGTATIDYATACGIATTTITVNVGPAISGPAAVCTGAVITLSDSQPGGTWSSSNPLATISGTGIVTGVTAGAAIITYVSTGGCMKTTTITVGAPLPGITGTTVVCTGSTVSLSNSYSGGMWSSSNTGVATISSTGIVTGVFAGTTNITYSTGGCTTSIGITVNQILPITGALNICAGAITALSDASLGGAWGSSNTAVATITPGGVLSSFAVGSTTITYSIPGGCSATYVVTANSSAPPITGDLNLCTGKPTALSDAAAPGGVWSSGNLSVATIDAGLGIITGISAGSVTITYSLGGSCVTTTLVTVAITPGAGNITGNPSVCVGAMITLNDTATGVWNSINDSATISGGAVTGVSAGTDTIQYIVSNGYCSDTAVKVITVYPLAIVDTISGPSIMCQGLTISLNDDVPGGVWISSYTAIATVGAGTGIVTGVSAGVDTIKYIVSNPACSDTASKVITVLYTPGAGNITGMDSACAGASFTLHDTATRGIWNSSNQSVATIDSSTGAIHTLRPGITIITYTTGSTATGCSNDVTFTVTVTAHAPFTINSTVSQINCSGDNDGSITVTISGSTGPLQYLWSNDSTSMSVTGLPPGPDTLNVIDTLTDCIATETYTITQPDTLTLTDSTALDICRRGTGSITTSITGGTPPYHYLWSNGDTSGDLSGLHSDTYTVTVTDANGCAKTLAIMVENNYCGDIIIHNVITPDGDGINDVWVIEGIENYPTNTVALFDKWGNEVYEKANYDNKFDGRGKSGELPDGTYYYLVKLNAENAAGGKNVWTGYLLIKR